MRKHESEGIPIDVLRNPNKSADENNSNSVNIAGATSNSAYMLRHGAHPDFASLAAAAAAAVASTDPQQAGEAEKVVGDSLSPHSSNDDEPMEDDEEEDEPMHVDSKHEDAGFKEEVIIEVEQLDSSLKDEKNFHNNSVKNSFPNISSNSHVQSAKERILSSQGL